MTTSPTFRKDLATDRGPGECRLCGSFLDPHSETRGDTVAHRKQRRGNYACVEALVCGLQLADPGITTEPGGLTASQSRPAVIFTAAAVPGRSAALDVCVASPNAAAARGDAAQAAPDRKRTHYQNETSELQNQGIHHRALIWTADGRPRPAATRTLQYAAEIAANRNGQQMSAKSLQRRWKHEIQIALLRRRAAMSRVVLPNPSARSVRLLAGIVDTAVQHWGYALPLDGAPGNHDRQANSKSDTAVPDDDDDFTTVISQSFESL